MRLLRPPKLLAQLWAHKPMALYQFPLCPFCIKTKRAMHRLGLNIEKRNAMSDLAHRERLEKEGGQIKVPCLLIEEDGEARWMYESNDIIAYLEKRFA
jgi:glutaredoxin